MLQALFVGPPETPLVSRGLLGLMEADRLGVRAWKHFTTLSEPPNIHSTIRRERSNHSTRYSSVQFRYMRLLWCLGEAASQILQEGRDASSLKAFTPPLLTLGRPGHDFSLPPEDPQGWLRD